MTTKLTFGKYSRIQVSVVLESFRKSPGYRVTLSFRASGDELWETIDHVTLFESDTDAERLAERVRNARAVDLAHWTWAVSQTSGFSFLHHAPTATAETTPRSPVRKAA